MYCNTSLHHVALVVATFIFSSLRFASLIPYFVDRAEDTAHNGTLASSEIFREWVGSRVPANSPVPQLLNHHEGLALVSRWDALTPVFLKPGPDGQPGAAQVDDDGNGVVDDASELGATGTDDVIVTPADREAYELAASNPAARVVSHGAMIPIWSSDSSLSLSSAMEQLSTPAELRIDAVDQQGKLYSRFISLR